MKTFSVSILGCRVNHYEADQIARLLKSRGLSQVSAPQGDIRVIHTCSVTSAAAKGSRQTVRKATQLKVLGQSDSEQPFQVDVKPNSRVIVTGCWATSDRETAQKLPGVDAVVTQHENLESRLTELLNSWHKPSPVNRLSILGQSNQPAEPAHQRAFLKIQDGCDAHCTYCIIPQLRPNLWSKSTEETVAEARSLVEAGHKEIVLTGIFLGAFGQTTALRRHQDKSTSKPIADLIRALCTQVPNLNRLRLSSLEPGDLDLHLLNELKKHQQIVPHFHLPLQSGSDVVLRKMNRQYNRTQFLEMSQMLRESYDRPAITTDIIVGFPHETEEEFEQTVDVVNQVKFIHTHAFSYSQRPKTAAARWTKQFVHSSVANQRIHTLNDLAKQHSLEFRRSFIGEIVNVIVERESDPASLIRHGRCERYFDVSFESRDVRTGDLVKVRIDQVDAENTHGSRVQ